MFVWGNGCVNFYDWLTELVSEGFSLQSISIFMSSASVVWQYLRHIADAETMEWRTKASESYMHA